MSSIALFAQEQPEINVEESAEVFLEEYTDEFQEYFFEALKQKGIENYDKAINLLLECKRMDAESSVVDHELANVYLADKQYIQARQYGLEALLSDPSNYWYLNTLVEVIEKQGGSIESLENEMPYGNELLKENLALIYFKNKKYETALNILSDMKKSVFSEELSLKIKDSLHRIEEQVLTKQPENTRTATEDPLEGYRLQISDLIQKKDFAALLKASGEAMETFPSQPYFYYANGLALNKSSNPNQAIQVLESALDYLLDDADLADNIYRELAEAHRSLGNTSKANMYLSKIKSGS